MEDPTIHLGDLIHDTSMEWSERVQLIVDRLRRNEWVRSLPDHELIHHHIDELERCGRAHNVVGTQIELAAIFDEALYFRVRIVTHIIVPKADTL